MINYTTRYVNIVSIIITILIYVFLSKSTAISKKFDFESKLISSILQKSLVLVDLDSNNINQETKEKNTQIENICSEISTKEENNKNNYSQTLTKEENVKKANWKIVIPKISLEAEISEGTSKEVMNKYVGHFEETTKTSGNVGLAAHNRGYEVNYFSQIKLLKQGDEIIYKCYNLEKTYIVSENKIIKDTDWSYLEKTEENKITLITCVENEPEYRRCIQGVEKN